MAKQVQFRGGTTAQHSTFTGAVREVTVDTDKGTLVVHDGVTAGGFPLRKEADSYTKTEVGTNFTPKDPLSGAVYMGAWTIATRPTLGAETKAIGFNIDLTMFEGWNGAEWTPVGGGATGGGTDAVFLETSYTVTQDYTITAGKSAITIPDANGNVTIADGVSITLPTGSVWVIPAVN